MPSSHHRAADRLHCGVRDQRGARISTAILSRPWLDRAGADNSPPHSTSPSPLRFILGPIGAEKQVGCNTGVNRRFGAGTGAASNSAANTIRRKSQQPAVVPTPQQPTAAPPQDGSPFASGLFRLPTLGLPPGLGTPKPTPEVQRQFDQFVQQEVSPENTLQVVVGRAKILMLREAPRRVYIPREDIAEYQLITPTQLAVVGKKVGTAVLSLWFADPASPNDPTRDHLLTYLVVVLSDPQAPLLERQRLESEVKAYEPR